MRRIHALAVFFRVIYNSVMSESAADTEAAVAGKTLRALRARAHSLKPVVCIASSGATPGVLREIDRALDAHELIKVRAAIEGRAEREEALASICGQLGAQPVQVIGKMLVVFRARPAKDDAARPAKARPGAAKKGPRGASARRAGSRGKRAVTLRG